MKDLSYADRQDQTLAEHRQEFARRILRWMADNGITYPALEKLSLAASGKVRLSGSQLNKLKRAAVEPERWNPQGGYLIGLAEVNALVDELSNGATAPPDLDPAFCAALQPLRNAKGEAMGFRDFVGAFYGLSGWAERTIAQRDKVEKLRGRLGELLERLAVEAGRSLLLDLDELLAEYPGDRDRLRAAIYRQTVLSIEEMDKALPAIAYALSKFTGQNWSRETLLARLENGHSSSPSLQPA